MNSNGIENSKNKQYVSFRIDDYLMGIDILKVREVNLLLDITPVQHTPDHIRGLINLRGQTVTVFDLGVKLGRSRRKITEQSHNIILKSDSVGILVDGIGDVISVNEDDIEPAPVNMDSQNMHYVENVVRLEKELMIIISPEKVLGSSGQGRDGAEVSHD